MCNNRIYVLGAVIGVFVLGGGKAWGQEGRLAYPATRRVDAVDLYHGVKVADPYRWLEAMESGLFAKASDVAIRKGIEKARDGELSNQKDFPPGQRVGNKWSAEPATQAFIYAVYRLL